MNKRSHDDLRGVYAITDATLTPAQRLRDEVERALLGGVHMVQYRDKSQDAVLRLAQATELVQLCHAHSALLIVNDDCYDSLQRAETAVSDGADYIAFGSFFASSIKPHAVRAPLSLLTEAKQRWQVPVCAIGGIDARNAPELIANGADMLAVISALFTAPDPQASALALSALFP
jgi:thiamine-phosphate pyrophosphorylase